VAPCPRGAPAPRERCSLWRGCLERDGRHVRGPVDRSWLRTSTSADPDIDDCRFFYRDPEEVEREAEAAAAAKAETAAIEAPEPAAPEWEVAGVGAATGAQAGLAQGVSTAEPGASMRLTWNAWWKKRLRRRLKVWTGALLATSRRTGLRMLRRRARPLGTRPPGLRQAHTSCTDGYACWTHHAMLVPIYVGLGVYLESCKGCRTRTQNTCRIVLNGLNLDVNRKSVHPAVDLSAASSLPPLSRATMAGSAVPPLSAAELVARHEQLVPAQQQQDTLLPAANNSLDLASDAAFPALAASPRPGPKAAGAWGAALKLAPAAPSPPPVLAPLATESLVLPSSAIALAAASSPQQQHQRQHQRRGEPEPTTLGEAIGQTVRAVPAVQIEASTSKGSTTFLFKAKTEDLIARAKKDLLNRIARKVRFLSPPSCCLPWSALGLVG
jgi:hypothetical protein